MALVVDKVWLQCLMVLMWGYFSFKAYKLYSTWRDDYDFGKRHGCERPQKELKRRLPLGIDIMYEVYSAYKAHNIMKWVSKLSDLYGPTFHIRSFGVTFAIMTSDPKNLQSILSTDFKDYGLGTRIPMLSPLLGDGIFTQDGPSWKHSRELLRPHFNRSQYHDLGVIREYVNRMLVELPRNQSFDMQPYIFRLTLKVTLAFLFGIADLEDTSDDDLDEFGDAFTSAAGNLGNIVDKLRRAVGLGLLKGQCATAHAFVDRLVQQALKKHADSLNKQTNGSIKSAKDQSFLDNLIDETTDAKVLRDQVLNVMLAGRDTTAVTISYALRLLLQHPTAMAKVRQELQTIITDGREPTWDDLRQLPYLNLVIKETLRLFPPVPVNARTAMKTTILPTGGGKEGTSPVLVRKDTVIEYYAWALHRRKDIYGADADKFRPERWEDDECCKNIGWSYLPFNGGPRICLGQEFAITETAYTLTRLLQAFPSITQAPEMPLPPLGEEGHDLNLVMKSADGCWLVLGNGITTAQ